MRPKKLALSTLFAAGMTLAVTAFGTITSSYEDVYIYSGDSNFFSRTLRSFNGIIEGPGRLISYYDLSFSGNAENHWGTLQISGGTFTVIHDSDTKLGTGKIDISPYTTDTATLSIGKTFSFSNDLESDSTGIVKIASGTTTYSGDASSFRGTFNIGNGATFHIAKDVKLNSDATFSGKGTIKVGDDDNNYATTLKGDISDFSGTYDVGAGSSLTLKDVNENASFKIGKNGTLFLSETREHENEDFITLSENISGDGTLILTNGTLGITGKNNSIGIKRLEVKEAATLYLDGKLNHTTKEETDNGTNDDVNDATLSVAGTVYLRGEATELVNLSGKGNIIVDSYDYNDEGDPNGKSVATLKGSASGFSGKITIDEGSSLTVEKDANLGNSDSKIVANGTLNVSGDNSFYSKEEEYKRIIPAVYSAISGSCQLNVSLNKVRFYGNIDVENVAISNGATMVVGGVTLASALTGTGTLQFTGDTGVLSGDVSGFAGTILVEDYDLLTITPSETKTDFANFSINGTLKLKGGEIGEDAPKFGFTSLTGDGKVALTSGILEIAGVLDNPEAEDVNERAPKIAIKTIEINSGAALRLKACTVKYVPQTDENAGAPNTDLNGNTPEDGSQGGIGEAVPEPEPGMLQLNGGVLYLTGNTTIESNVSGTGTIVVRDHNDANRDQADATLNGGNCQFKGQISVERNGILAIGNGATLPDASASFFVAEDAQLRLGAPDSREDKRIVSNTIQGNGTLQINAGFVSFAKENSLKIKNLDLAGGRLLGDVVLTHDNARLNLAGGTVELNVDASEKISFLSSHAEITLGAQLCLTGENTDFDKLDGGNPELNTLPESDAEIPEKIKNGEKIVIFDGGKVVASPVNNLPTSDDLANILITPNGGFSWDRNENGVPDEAGDVALTAAQMEAILQGMQLNPETVQTGTVDEAVEAFLRTDTSLEYVRANNYSVVYDTSNGLNVQTVRHEETNVRNMFSIHEGLSDEFLSHFFGENLEIGYDYVSAVSDPLIAAVLTNPGAATTMLNNLSPLAYSAMVVMPTEAFYSDRQSVSSRLRQQKGKVAKEGQLDFFVQAQMSSVENDGGTDTPVFDYDTTGALAGIDYQLNEKTRVGIAFGSDEGEAKIHDGGGKIEMSDFRATAFVGRYLESGLYLSAGAHLGYASFDAKRNTVLGNPKADTTGWTAGLFADAGMDFSVNTASLGTLVFTPSVGLAYAHSRIDSFAEDSGLYDVDTILGDSLRMRLGCEVSTRFSYANADWRAGVDLDYSHDFLGEEVDIDAGFNGSESDARVTAKALAEDMITLSPSLSVDVSPYCSVYATYALDIGSNSATANRINIGLKLHY